MKSRRVAILFIALLTPSTALAQPDNLGTPEANNSETVGEWRPNDEVLIEIACTASEPRLIARALTELRARARQNQELSLELVGRCLESPNEPARTTLILSFLEGLSSSVLLRSTRQLLHRPRDVLRTQVALANIEGAYGELSLSINWFLESGGSEEEARNILSNLTRPRTLPADPHDAAGLAAVRSWLSRLGVVPIGRGAFPLL